VRGSLREIAAMPRRQQWGVALAGVILAAHFSLFVWGLVETSLPAAVSLVSLEPLAVVLLAWVLHGIRPTRLEQIGVTIATLGALVVGSGRGTGRHRLFGDLLVLGAVALYGLYISCARAFRGTLRAQTYAGMVYAWAALATGVALLILPPMTVPTHSLWAVAALALIPTVLGHTAVQAAARTTSPSIVALVSPAETVGALIIGAFWLSAWPSGRELAGAAVIVLGVTVGILGAR
jgi:drug/metabolite transporter (DMT)-like permease